MKKYLSNLTAIFWISFSLVFLPLTAGAQSNLRDF
jgi:membrane-anchored glycerophosphoryl diester phosphodiesterase (GDPDase)